MKALIIYGSDREQKIQKAREYFFNAKSGLLVDAMKFARNPQKTYNRCTADTDIIVVLECQANFDFEIFFNAITEGVEIKKRHKEPIRIYPRLVFVSHCTQLMAAWNSRSFRERFKSLNMDTYFEDLPF